LRRIVRLSWRQRLARLRQRFAGLRRISVWITAQARSPYIGSLRNDNGRGQEHASSAQVNAGSAGIAQSSTGYILRGLLDCFCYSLRIAPAALGHVDPTPAAPVEHRAGFAHESVHVAACIR
jgi:hypothetical protein